MTSGPREHLAVHLRRVLIVACLVEVAAGLDVSMVAVALPSIGTDLGLGATTLQWIVGAYVLGYGGLLLLGGRACDLAGRRRVLLVSLGVFLAASLTGALASSGAVLVAARFVKGAAAAFAAPAALSTLTTTFPEGPRRNRALTIFGAFGASGSALGFVLSGILTQAGWRWTFLAPVPIAAITLLAAARHIPAQRRGEHRGGYDVAGAAAGVAAALLLVFTVVSAPTAGWGSVRTLVGLAATAVLGALFVGIEHRTRRPLIRLGMLRLAPLRRANIVVAAFFGAFVAFQYVAMLFLQTARHWSPLHTALAFLPAPLIVAVGSRRAGAILSRFGTPRVIAVSLATQVAAYLLFLRAGEDSSYLTGVLPTIILLGVGFLLGFPALNLQGTAGVDHGEQGVASGLINSSTQIGAAVVLAVVTAVATANSGTAVSASTLAATFRPSLAVPIGVAVLGLAVALWGIVRPGTGGDRGGQKIVAAEQTRAADRSSAP